MIVLIKKYPDEGVVIDDRVDCESAHQISSKDNIHLVLYREGRIVHDELFTEKTRIFFMEKGKTIDSITFKVNPK